MSLHQRLAQNLKQALDAITKDALEGRIVGGAVVLFVQDENGRVRPQATISGPVDLAIWGLSGIVEGLLKRGLVQAARVRAQAETPAPDENGDVKVN